MKQKVTFDQYGNAQIAITPICPNCSADMKTDLKQTAWTEGKDLVVVPVFCPACSYSCSIHICIS